jgi:hypothetical protein
MSLEHDDSLGALLNEENKRDAFHLAEDYDSLFAR